MRTWDEHELREHVVQVTAAVLATDPVAVDHSRELPDLPGFDSVAVVEILETLERELGIEVPAEAIVPEAFTDVAALVRLLVLALEDAS